MKHITNSYRQTKLLAGRLLSKALKARTDKAALVFALQGDLGSGKTTFTQGLALSLGIREKITSPTFVMLRKFKIQKARFKSSSQNSKLSKHKKDKNIFVGLRYLYHIDCYRIKNTEEILALGLKQIITEPQNVVAVEWPDVIKKIIPKNTFWIEFRFINKNKREINCD